jgi:hypothetical protein
VRHNLNKTGSEYSLTSAMRVGGTRKPRTRTVALTDCVCFDRDGNEINRIARTQSNKIRTPRTRTITVKESRSDILLMARMGTIHQDDN